MRVKLLAIGLRSVKQSASSFDVLVNLMAEQ